MINLNKSKFYKKMTIVSIVLAFGTSVSMAANRAVMPDTNVLSDSTTLSHAVGKYAAEKVLSTETIERGKLIVDIGEHATSELENVDPVALRKNAKGLFGGMKTLWSGTKKAACGLYEEGKNVVRSVKGGAVAAAGGAELGYALARDLFAYATSRDDIEFQKTTLSYKEQASELLASGSLEALEALKKTPGAFLDFGKGAVEMGSGVIVIIEEGKPIYDFVIKVAPYVATACTVIAA